MKAEKKYRSFPSAIVSLTPLLYLVCFPFLSSCSTQATNEESVLIHCAASTSEVTKEIAKQFQSDTGIQIRVNSAGSNTLASQILSGAPGDLFLSANRHWSERITDQGLSEESAPLLSGRLVLITTDKSLHPFPDILDLKNLAYNKMAVASPSVPIGTYTEKALHYYQLEEAVKSKIVYGKDAAAVLGYVLSQETELGISYQSDAQKNLEIQILYQFPERSHPPITYHLTRLKQPSPNSAADKFYQFLQSQQAMKLFAKHGFLPAEKRDTPKEAGGASE